MKEFIHWEWRGFGAVTPRFAEEFLALPIYTKFQKVDDLYIWAPGLETNIKFRTGAEDGLKFKRREDTQAPFQKWREDPNEIFDMPLNQDQWNTLATEMKACGIDLPAYEPSICSNRQAVQKTLRSAGSTLIQVSKQRTARYYNHNAMKIAVEWAVISSPVKSVSIGLENVDKHNNDNKTLSGLHDALESLGLSEEPLNDASYLNMLEKWAPRSANSKK